MGKYLVTAALPYANGPIHIGHLAGCYLPADIFVRYMRMAGHDVLFICGSDEHGVPITIKAEEEGKTCQQIVDYYHDIMESSFERFGVKFNNFSKTSLPLHHENAKEFFLKLKENGYISKQKEKQYYCSKCSRFLPDRYVEGICPHCSKEGARGDQCDACGKVVDNVSLIEPKCKLCGSSPEIRETEHFYLDLDKFEGRLKEWLEQQTNWKDNVREFALGWIKEGLKPRAITRDLSWGVKVPLEGYGDKVLYVWFDAPIGYLSSTMEWAVKSGVPDRWKEYWHDKDCRMIHFLGKDNIVFHAVIWPSMLMGVGGYNLPYNIPANEYLNIEGKKLSTSRNWAIWLDDYLDNFNPDILRYALAATLPESKDTDFSWGEFQSRNNSELADIFGNFVNRTVQFVKKFNGGKIAETPSLNEDDKNFLKVIEKKAEDIGALIGSYQLRKAAYEFMDIARESNKYFTITEPWKIAKTDKERLDTVLYVCMKAVSLLAYVSEPFIPFTSLKMKKYLSLEDVKWNEMASVNPPHVLPEEELGILFVKIEDSVIEAQKEKLGKPLMNKTEKKEAVKEKEYIEFEQFKKAKLVVAKILSAEKVKGADKLLKLHLETGDGERDIVAGVALFYKPEDMVGKKIVIVKNLKPAKIRGVESNGMLLAASNNEKTRLNVLFVEDSESGDNVG